MDSLSNRLKSSFKEEKSMVQIFEELNKEIEMENKLIPMTDFVINSNEKRMSSNPYNERDYDNDFIRSVNEYAKFLSQPLTLGMFIPCDEDGNPWVYPPTNEEWEWAKKDSTEAEQSFKQKEYLFNEAKSRVLFEGFEIEQSKSRIGFYLPEYNCIDYSIVQNNFSSPSKWLTTIEDLIIYSGLILTPTAIKSIYGS
ncbi:hypothetical protein HZP42_19105 [Elizabethkingia anophelis]|nr:hypothetical protein [Elizabethkingia anophelis]